MPGNDLAEGDDMATTCFFDEVIQDKKEPDGRMRLEFGRSSLYGGENLIYLTIDDKTQIVDEATGRKICDAMWELGVYLAYDKAQ